MGAQLWEPRLDVTTNSVACESARATERLLGPVWGQTQADVTARKLAAVPIPDATKEREFRRRRRLKVWARGMMQVADQAKRHVGAVETPQNTHPGRRQVLVHLACSAQAFCQHSTRLGSAGPLTVRYKSTAARSVVCPRLAG